jgi:hypothetical protein
MKDCPDCQKRTIWAFRAYSVYRWIERLPKGENTGMPVNINSRSILKWLACRYVLGGIQKRIYQQFMKEGKQEYDYRKQTRTSASNETAMPGVRYGVSPGERESAGRVSEVRDRPIGIPGLSENVESGHESD